MPVSVGENSWREQALPKGAGREQEGCLWSRGLRLALFLLTLHRVPKPCHKKGDPSSGLPSPSLGRRLHCVGG